MNKRDFLQIAFGLCAATGGGAAAASGQTTSGAKAFPVLSADLAAFLAETEPLRRRRFSGGPDSMHYAAALQTAKEIEAVALKKFEAAASKGSRRHRFYLGRVYTELGWMTEEDSYLKIGREHLIVAEKQGHPDAVTFQIRYGPRRQNFDLYNKAIRLGSVTALGRCIYNCHDAGPEEWMKSGPVRSVPEQAASDMWSDLFKNWMIIYHFLIRWDSRCEYFRLSFPNKDLIAIMCCVDPVGPGYEEPFSPDFLVNCVEEASRHARGMDTDFYPEEIHDIAWNRLYRFRD